MSFKQNISSKLAEHIAQLGLSQTKVAAKIGGISPATVNSIVNFKWMEQDGLVSDAMWQNVANYLGEGNEWITVEIRNFKAINRIAHDCQTKGIARAIAGEPGRCKSEALRSYASRNQNTFYIECDEHWTKKHFLNKLRQAMGLPIEQQSIGDIMEEILQHLNKLRKPIIIIDEVDKLQDKWVGFFITLYNKAKSCGFMLSGSVFFEKNFLKGVRLNKRGYCEAYSRFGKEFIAIKPVDAESVRAICETNGLTDDMKIKEVINSCDGDLRRVNRMVTDFKMMQK